MPKPPLISANFTKISTFDSPKPLVFIFSKAMSNNSLAWIKFPLIFISHNIPYNTKLDIGKDKNSYAYKKHLGSYVARKFCEKYQPLLCVGGDVHEGKGKDKIGKTILINPGFGKDAQVLIELNQEKGKIKKIEFYKKKKWNHKKLKKPMIK